MVKYMIHWSFMEHLIAWMVGLAEHSVEWDRLPDQSRTRLQPTPAHSGSSR